MIEPDKVQGRWIPLMDYAMRRSLSLSTLRRYIKAKKVLFKLEHGRYLIWDEIRGNGAGAESEEGSSWDTRVRMLEEDLQKAHEEIAELKTLIAFYEEKIHKPLDN